MPHQKSPDGYLSVTEVLDLVIHKHFLYYWAGKHGLEKCERIKRESQELGTEVHKLIEWQFMNPNTLLSSESNSHRMVNNFWHKFVIPMEAKCIEMEVTRSDEKLKLQGTIDAVLDTIKWKNVTTDYKTSNQLDTIGVPLQLSMYDYLRKGEGKGCAIRIDKESNVVQTVWYSNLKDYDKIWKSALKLARYIKFKEI